MNANAERHVRNLVHEAIVKMIPGTGTRDPRLDDALRHLEIASALMLDCLLEPLPTK